MALTNIPERAKINSMRLIARALAARRLEVRVTGIDNVPMDGPALLVARHYHHLFDGLALLTAVPRSMYIVVAVDWVQTQTTRRLLESLARAARWPVVLRNDALTRPERSKRNTRIFSSGDYTRYARKAFRDCLQLLSEGRLLVWFPEAYPNIDPHFTPKTEPGEFLPFKSGFTVIAAALEKRLGAPVPLIPAGLNYEPGHRWITHLRFGKQVYANDFDSRAGLTKHLEREVARLSLGAQAQVELEAARKGTGLA